MTTADRRAREKQAVEDKILAAARDLFAERGYEGVTMRAIAEAIEYSPPVIYSHFRDKEALLTRLCFEDFARLASEAYLLADVADPVDRIRHLGRRYIRFAIEHPNHYRVMFMTRFPDHDLTEQELQVKGRPDADGYAFLRQAVAHSIDAGRLLPEINDAELATQTLWACVHGAAALAIDKANDPWIDWAPIERRITLICDAPLRGMLRDPSTMLPLREPGSAPPASKAGKRGAP